MLAAASGEPARACNVLGQDHDILVSDHAVKWLAPVAGAVRFAQNQ
jgi:hypothetical protein